MDLLLLTLIFLGLNCLSFAGELFSDTWAVHIDGGPDVALRLAEEHEFTYLAEIMPDYYEFKHRRVSRRSVESSDHYHQRLLQDPRVKWAEQQRIKRRVKRGENSISFNDPTWPRLWYIHRGAGLDMNLLPAYEQWKITGKGVVVTILDDGIEKDHPDLQANYDAGASYDVNGKDSDPQPRYDDTNENRHGTRCAGEVAAQANNNICSVGVAYEASIGGVRMLDGDVTDAVEAQSISLNPQHIDIYSASWGPDDDGRTVDGPGPLAKKAFLDGIEKGRRGRGSIFVWASGNGGLAGDGCNCDGYTNSMYTLSISSSSENGNVPWYSESCSSTLATTYSSGANGERQIITTDLHKACTETHTGTSASAPLAAGICALALQANPSLTWRDMQHIVVMTARRANLHADDWVTNGAGRNVSHHFGFGLMDAAAMVALATKWTTVPKQRRCSLPANISTQSVPMNGQVDHEIVTDGCRGDNISEIVYLEHVECIITLSSSVRGRVHIYLISPQGTRSTLLSVRSKDTSNEGFNEWPFMTTHSWGESPVGKWRLEIHNGASTVTLKSWALVLYGTATRPFVPKAINQPRTLNQEPCGTDRYFLRSMCYTECPTGYFPFNSSASAMNETDEFANGTDYSTNTAFCLECHTSCNTCIGPALNNCASCALNRKLTSDHYCVDTEPDYVNDNLRLLLSVLIPCTSVLVVIIVIVIAVRMCNNRGNVNMSSSSKCLSHDQRPLLNSYDNDVEYSKIIMEANTADQFDTEQDEYNDDNSSLENV